MAAVGKDYSAAHFIKLDCRERKVMLLGLRMEKLVALKRQSTATPHWWMGKRLSEGTAGFVLT